MLLKDRVKGMLQMEVDKYKELATSPWIISHVLMLWVWFWWIPGMLAPYYIELAKQYDQVTIFIFGCWGVRLFFQVIGMIIFGTFHYFKFPWIEQYASRRETYWEEDPEEWNSIFWTLIRSHLIQYFVLYPLVLYTHTKIFAERLPRIDIDSIPSGWEMMFTYIILIYIEDFFDGTQHRIFHHPSLYHFHKVHHSIKNTNFLASEYQHPVECVFMLSTLFYGIYILGPNNVHMFFWLIYFGLSKLGSFEDHCGYSFPHNPIGWLPLIVPGTYHDYHHIANIGCIQGVFIYLDVLSGDADHYMENHYFKKDNTVLDSPYKRLYKPLAKKE